MMFCSACTPVSPPPPVAESPAPISPAAVEKEGADEEEDVFGWEAMPEITASESAAGAEDLAAGTPTHPRGEPSGRFLSLEHSVWQAGFQNGHPRHPGAEVPEGEYGPERFGEPVVHIRDPNDLPPFLESSQRLVLHLPPFPADLYTVKVALGTPSEFSDPWSEYGVYPSILSRQLVIRWNDKVIYNGHYAPHYGVVSALVFPDEILPGGNLLTLDTAETRSVALDAIWLEAARPDTAPFGVLAEQAHWVNREQALWIRQTQLRVDAPEGSPDRSVPVPFLQLAPPDSAREVQERWRGAAERFQHLVDLDHPDVAILRTWIAPLGEAVRRGIVPSVEVFARREQKTMALDAAMYVFGDIIHSWSLFTRGQQDEFIQRNPDRVPDIRLVLGGESRRQPGAPPTPQWVSTSTPLEYLLGLAHSHMWYFAKEDILDQYHVRDMGHSARVHIRDGNAHLEGASSGRSESLLGTVSDVLMHTRHQLLVRGLQPAGPFFPDGSDRACASWHYLKPLFRFGGPTHRRGHMRIRSGMDSLSMGNTRWAAADNGRDSVHVFVFNPHSHHGREVTLEVPLPWAGATRVLHHQNSIRWQQPASLKSETLLLEAQPMAGDLPAPHPYVSILRMGITLNGLHVLELSPPDRPVEDRSIQAPERVGFAGMNTTESLFTASRQPPPAWWSSRLLIHNRWQDWQHRGPVEVKGPVAATLAETPDLEARVDFREPGHVRIQGVPPRQAESVRLRFPEPAADNIAFAHSFMLYHPLHGSRTIGLWVLAHRPAGLNAPSGTSPEASFYLGKPPYRQRIVLPYGTWTFLHAPSERVREQDFGYQPRLLIWPDPANPHPLDLEINDISGYVIARERNAPVPEQTLGFLREREDGKLVLLLVGTPGKAGFWRQRLERAVDTAKLARVLSAATVQDTAEPVFEYHPASRVLETSVKRFPEATDEALLSRIRRDFPAVADRLREGQLSAVLWEER